MGSRQAGLPRLPGDNGGTLAGEVRLANLGGPLK
jgi:hypothetical protein